jgi:heme/copper-type cytochrome/quinol oxidase subunit 3
MPAPRPVLDLAGLPTYAFGPASPMWWGTLGFIAMEAVGFALAAGSFLYIAHLNGGFPLGAPPPDAGPGTVLTLLLLASAVPNLWLDRVARREEIGKVRLGLVLMSALGLAGCAIRILEFPALNIGWDANAYGSLQWLLLGLHTTHIVTDVADTLVLTALMFTRHAHGKRFSDVSDNCAYWYFVVASWLPIYALIYGVPRL